ncbi:hypothetical protein ACFQX6_67015 [Streptosporangium lutulentum]
MFLEAATATVSAPADDPHREERNRLTEAAYANNTDYGVALAIRIAAAYGMPTGPIEHYGRTLDQTSSGRRFRGLAARIAEMETRGGVELDGTGWSALARTDLGQPTALISLLALGEILRRRGRSGPPPGAITGVEFARSLATDPEQLPRAWTIDHDGLDAAITYAATAASSAATRRTSPARKRPGCRSDTDCASSPLNAPRRSRPKA